MIELIGTIATILAVTGVILNNRRLRFCFVLWLVSNSLSFAIHVTTGVSSLAIRDAVFLLLAVEGWFRWKQKPTDGRTLRRLLARESEMRQRAVDIAKRQLKARKVAEQAKHVCERALMRMDDKIKVVQKHYCMTIAQLKRCIEGRN